MRNLLVFLLALLLCLGSSAALATDSETWADDLWAKYQAAAAEGKAEEAMDYLFEGEAGNDTRSIMQIGMNYLDGYCVEQDYAKALDYLQRSTDAGDRKAPRYIALMYQNGQGVQQDDAKAVEYFTIGSEAGDSTSTCYLGRYYEYGIAVEQDYAKALELFEAGAAAHGTIYPAMIGLASMYEHGWGVEQNLETAAEWYAQAIENNAKTAEAEPLMVTAVTDVFGNGERITGVIIKCEKEIDARTVTQETFTVANRTITGLWVSDTAEIPEESHNGRFVIITLDPQDADEYASVYRGGIVNGGNGPTGTSGTGVLKYVYTDVKQVLGYETTDGTTILPASVSYENHAVISNVIDDFEQRTFEDAENDTTVLYNLFVPRDYDASQKYPLVLFMADASANGPDVMRVLRQGNGATVFASEEEQAKHPCFVVAVQFAAKEGAASIMNLLNALAQEFSIDENRIYTTGQSQGCIMSIALDETYRDVFAGLLLVSGQSDAEGMRVMSGDNIWIIVSEGDKRGFPGMNEIVALWEEDGAVIAKGTWDATWSAEEFDAAAAQMRAEGTNIKYTAFIKGTTWDGDPAQEDPNEHNSAMHVAYNIEAVRDWLFEQVRGEVHP